MIAMTDSSLRPSLLDPLFAPARTLPGVGAKVAPLIEKLLGTPEREARIVDLLFHLPQGGVARRLVGSVAEAPACRKTHLSCGTPSARAAATLVTTTPAARSTWRLAHISLV